MGTASDVLKIDVRGDFPSLLANLFCREHDIGPAGGKGQILAMTDAEPYRCRASLDSAERPGAGRPFPPLSILRGWRG